MKKFLVVLSVLVFAAGAFAQDVKPEEKKGPEFKYQFDGIAFGAKGAQKDYSYDYSHIRVRPFFTAGNENVKGVVRLEIDQDFGAEANTKSATTTATAASYVDTATAGAQNHTHTITTTATTDFGAIGNPGADSGTDNQIVEVKWAFIEVSNVLVDGLTIKAGLAGYYFPLVVDQDFAMYQTGYDFGIGKAVFSYIKINEMNVNNKKVTASTGVVSDRVRDDVDMYALDVPVKLGEITIRPGFIYFAGEKEAAAVVAGKTVQFRKLKAYNAALNINGDFGIVKFDASGALLKGNSKADDAATSLTKTETETKYSAYAGDVIVTVKPVDMFKASLFFTLYSGDKDTTAANHTDKGYMYTMDAITGTAATGGNATGAPNGRLFLLDAGSWAAGNGGKYYFDLGNTVQGLRIYGANAEIKIDKFNLLAQYAYVTFDKKLSVTDPTTTLVKKYNKVGQEVDVRATLEVAPKTVLFGEGGYVFAGNGFSKTAVGFYTDKSRNFYEAAFGVKTSI